MSFSMQSSKGIAINLSVPHKTPSIARVKPFIISTRRNKVVKSKTLIMSAIQGADAILQNQQGLAKFEDR